MAQDQLRSASGAGSDSPWTLIEKSVLLSLIGQLTQGPAFLVIIVPCFFLVLYNVVSYYASPLRKYPGPRLGAWTNLWRMYHAWSGDMHLVTKDLHNKYGPVVRVAPNHLDVDYSSMIKTCFDFKGVWKKTEFHGVSGVLMDGKIFYNVFSETDPVEHAKMKKPIAKYYSPAGVAPLESHLDSVIGHLCRRFEDQFVADGPQGDMGKPFDFGEWMLFFAWDVVGKATWSKKVGYLDHGHDFDGTLNVSEKAMDYLVTVGMIPQLDSFLDKNRIYRIGPPSFANITNLAVGRLMDRYTGKDGHDPAKPDFLDKALEAKKEFPDIVDDGRILSYMLINLAAGADTTALSLRSIFYLSLKHPQVWSRLEHDITSAPFARPGATMQLPASYAQARSLPYLEAVIREALRLYPGSCFAQERYVPEGGVSLPDGDHVPAGVALGFNAYVLHRNKGVWGEDAEVFRPERWLRAQDDNGAETETEEEFKARLTRMNANDLSFGAGSRKCIGMNLGMMDVYKTVATMVAMFRFELSDPVKEWKIHNSMFPRQSGVVLRIGKREGVKLRSDLEIDD